MACGLLVSRREGVIGRMSQNNAECRNIPHQVSCHTAPYRICLGDVAANRICLGDVAANRSDVAANRKCRGDVAAIRSEIATTRSDIAATSLWVAMRSWIVAVCPELSQWAVATSLLVPKMCLK